MEGLLPLARPALVASDLPKAFFDENFAFFGKTLLDQKEPTPRWKQCTAMTDGALGEAVGQDWVKKNFPPAAKASMDQLVTALEKSLGDDIKTLPWMSDETKKAAEEKLAMIRNKIGYPEKWRDYSALKIKPDDLIGNLRRDSVFSRDYNLNKLGKPVDEKEWGMTPPTVNAYYSSPTTTSTSPPVFCSRPSSTSPSTPPSTSAASASSSDTR